MHYCGAIWIKDKDVYLPNSELIHLISDEYEVIVTFKLLLKYITLNYVDGYWDAKRDKFPSALHMKYILLSRKYVHNTENEYIKMIFNNTF